MLNEASRKVAAAVSIALAVGACDPVGGDKSAGDSGSNRFQQNAEGEKYKLNLDPKQRYGITMTVMNAPGPFVIATAFAQYKASDCWYSLNRLEGVVANPEISLPMTYTKISDTTYFGTVYLDAMVDENYYGDGECHWRFMSAAIVLKATGEESETGFIPILDRRETLSSEPVTTYFRKELYPRAAAIEDYSAFGQTDRSKVSARFSDAELFTVVLSSKKVHPIGRN